MYPKPVALNFPSLLHFLDFLLHDAHKRKYIIMCMTRETFLHQLLQSSSSSNADPEVEAESASSLLLQKLLTPNLNNLSKSQKISIIFKPTVQQLRAYLGSIDGPLEATTLVGSELDARMDSRPPLLAIYDFLDLHIGTSEFSAQGLSRTMALVMQAIIRVQVRLMMAECDRSVDQDLQPEQDDPNTGILSEGQQVINPYIMEVPVLNRASGLGRDGLHWAGKSVQVGRIWARWCSFPTG